MLHSLPGRTLLGRAAIAACGVSALLLLPTAASLAAADPGSTEGGSRHRGEVITVTTAKVGAPDNPSVAVAPFVNAIYANRAACTAAQPGADCLTVGRVRRPYEI